MFGWNQLHHVVDDDEGDDGAHGDQDCAGVVVHLRDRPDLDVASERRQKQGDHEGKNLETNDDRSRQTGRTIVFSLQGITHI